MMKGAMGKRLNYFFSSFLRIISFLSLLIAYIVVKLVVSPQIPWLNILLLSLSLGGLVSGFFNLGMASMTATGYKSNKFIQILCLIVTIVTGGLVATTLTAVALGTKIDQAEIDAEKIIKIKKSRKD